MIPTDDQGATHLGSEPEFSKHARKNLFPRAVMHIEIGAVRKRGLVTCEIDEIVDAYILDEPTRHRKSHSSATDSFGDAIDQLTRHYPRSVRKLTFAQWLRAVFTARYQP